MHKLITVLMILDGFGLREEIEGNAIRLANTPNLDKIMKKYPWAKGNASGLSVGLPEGQMGNSEVGHSNIGAGRVVYQEFTKITKSIEDRTFFENKVLLNSINFCKKNNSSLHLMGLLSNGGVHSHIEHLYALLELLKNNNFKKVFIHVFMDGRDTCPNEGKNFIFDLESKIKEMGIGSISTISGRFYAMDRDKRWERIEKVYNAIVLGKGNKSNSALECVKRSYDDNITDEFIVPTVIDEKGTIEENDCIICFNFRPDRVREITRVFCDDNFEFFKRKKEKIKIKYVCFTEYDPEIGNKEVVFKEENIKNTLGEYISDLGFTQLRLAETEKYAHVTFFFNGGREKPYKNEYRILVNSPKVETYDLQPEMSAFEVTDHLINAIESKKYDLIVINYANPDMVGHTGILSASIKAIETVDQCIGKVLEVLVKTNSQMFICSDHGNSDKVIDNVTKKPFTAHTTNPVPFIIVNCNKVKGIREDGRLCDIAPTILDMMNLEKPIDMTGISLLEI